MKSQITNRSRFLCIHWVACVSLLFLAGVPTARAGLTLEMNVIQYYPGGYYTNPYLSTNATPPNLPFGTYQLASAGYPTNGYSALYRFDTNGFYQIDGYPYGFYNGFTSLVQGLTNGNWNIFATNSVTTNVYTFTITANLSSNDLPPVTIHFPMYGTTDVTNRPTFTWEGPATYSNLIVYYFNDADTLPVTQTSYLCPRVLYQGLNNLTVHYDNYPATALVASVPLDVASQPICSWVSKTHLQDYAYSQFTVGMPDTSGTSHTLVAHYPWNFLAGNGSASGADTSGNGYNLNFEGSYGDQGGVNSVTDAAAGPRAIEFHDGDQNSAGYVGWLTTPPAVLSALAGSFSVSCWIKTTQNNFGWDQAPAYYGAGIISADNDGLANDVVPLALTGNTIGFNTGGDDEDVTLNSVAYVNDGNYHHVVVTRNQATGQKIIYIDGAFDSFGSGTTNLLNDPQMVTIGALSGAGYSDPSYTYYYNGFDGEVDDLQIYSGVLSAAEVAQLHNDPGLTVDQAISQPLIARYNFEDPDSSGIDSSGNGNNANCGSGNGGPNEDTPSPDAAVGNLAREFFGDTSICFFPGGAACFDSLSNALLGSFSWTAWVKTTNSVNDDFANAYYGSPIWFEYADNVNQAIFSITGSKAAFTVGNPDGGSDTTLHSTTSVNDGVYHFLAVTRNEVSGLMSLYVDGKLEATGVSTNGPRIASSIFYLAGGYDGNFAGLLDDVRVYGGELTASDVATLSGHLIDGSGGEHKNIAHYAFDNSENLGQDSSGNGNDMSGPVTWGPLYQFDSDAEAGSGAIQFFGTSALHASDQTLTNLNAVLAGSFTVSAWVKTTVSNGEDYNNSFYGATIFWAYNDHGGTNDTIPLSITGSKAAFTTRDHLGNDSTLHSISSVNDGNYHLITVTRNQTTGEKRIYVDGNFESSEIGATDRLNGNDYNLTIGGYAYCADSECTNFYAYKGLLDDFQIYSGVLSDAEVASLFANPGTTVPDVSDADGPVVHYDFDEGTALAADVSGNFNNVVHAGNFDGSGPWISSDAAAGPGAVGFDGGSYLTASSNLLSALAGEFTVSLWLKTSQSFGGQGDFAWNGAVVVGADSPNPLARDVIPVALTGGQVAFNVGDSSGDNTMNSSATVNDDTWHHVVVTRNQATGGRQIFIDGTLDSSSGGATGLLNDPVLLTIGCKSDATDPDPASPDYTGSNGYEGLLDDVQVYPRVLTPDEVAFLHQNPGAVIGNSNLPDTTPVSVDLTLDIYREQDATFGDIFIAFPGITSITPAATGTTTNVVESPTGKFHGEVNAGNGGTYSYILSSYSDLMNELTNGLWTLYINKGKPDERQYHFSATADGLTTNVLAAVRIVTPTNGATGVAPNTSFLWLGPSNYSTLNVSKQNIDNTGYSGTSLDVTATNWPSPPVLAAGTNRFYITYDSNYFTGMTFSLPVDATFSTVSNWVTRFNLHTTAQSIFVVSTAPLPMTLVKPMAVGTNLQFQFLSQSGFSHYILYRTNLAVGGWKTNSTISGDGTLKTISVPFSLFSPSRQGFIRVWTQ
jgi:hypothetical protein